MDFNLRSRFLLQKLRDIISGNKKPLPTILCERDDPRSMELVRRNCLFAPTMVPFHAKYIPIVMEVPDLYEIPIDYGYLYIDVKVN